MKKIRVSFHSEVPKENSCLPLQLIVLKTGLVRCSKKDCIDFCSFSICAHSLAVAAYTDKVEKLINSQRKAPRSRLLNLSNFGNSSGVGSKKGYKHKHTRKQKQAIITGMSKRIVVLTSLQNRKPAVNLSTKQNQMRLFLR